MGIRYPYMITAVIRIDLARTHSALDREPLHLYTLTQIIEQRLSVRENLNIFRMASDTLIIFYGSTSRSVRTDLTALLEDLSDTLSANLPAPLLIGIGSVVEYVEELRDSYTKALYALSVNQHQNRLPVLSYYDLSPTENDGTEYWEVQNVLSRIAANFASTDKHEILALLTTALERLQEMRDTDLNAAIHYCCSMISLALECLPANDTLREDNPYLTISRMKDLGSLYETVFRILSEVDGAIRTTQESQTERLAEACRKEINTHFDTKLTIEKLAEKLGVSRNYLSTIFRAKTGYSINEYLNLTRLEEAKRLLRESSILIYEVAERSGFSDQYYFSKVFKAHVGVTPNEYRYNYQH